MSESTQLPSAERPVDVAEYQPLSGLAVAALAVSALFAIILAVIVVTGFYTRKPALNSDLLLLAIAAFVLAIAARVQIRRSEGTRTGQKLASAAWWISLIGGLGYGAYIFASGLALRSQSREFAELWFTNLQRKDLETAFVLTIEPVRWPRTRQVIPEEVEAEFPQQLQMFRVHELVQLYQRHGEGVRHTFLGIRDWDYQLTGYHVATSWKLSSPEGERELILSLNGSEGKDVVGRQWHVNLATGSGLGDLKPTRYGRAVGELQGASRNYFISWMMILGANPTVAYARTLPEGAGRAALEGKLMALALTAGGGAGSVVLPEVPAPAAFPTGFFQFTGKGLDREKVEATFQRIWKSGAIRPAGVRGPRAEPPILSNTESEVRIRVPVDIELPEGGLSRGYVHVVASKPTFVEKVWELRQEGVANAGNPPQERGDVLPGLPAPGWRIAGIESPLEPMPTGPDGSPMPGGMQPPGGKSR